jgi:hypothetical protein
MSLRGSEVTGEKYDGESTQKAALSEKSFYH